MSGMRNKSQDFCPELKKVLRHSEVKNCDVSVPVYFTAKQMIAKWTMGYHSTMLDILDG